MFPLAPIDAAWLGMDRPSNPMVVTAVIRLARSLSAERLAELMDTRILSVYPPFRWRIGPSGAEEVLVHVADHVDVLMADDAGDAERDLERLVTAWAAIPLDPARPRWQLAVVHGPAPALLARVHHGLGDGFALARVLLTLMDPGPEAPPRPRPPDPPWFDAVLGTPAALDKLLLTPADTSPLRRTLSGDKRFAWTRTWPLGAVTARAHAADVTVNDTLLAALGGALGVVLGPDAPATIRAFVPVNIRPPDAPIPPELGNQFGLVLVDVPLAASAAARLAALHAQMEAIKASPEAWVAFGLVEVIGSLPSVLEQPLVDAVFAPKGSMIVTNVPGPHETLAIDGIEVTDIGFWVPQAADVGLGVSLLSYAGKVSVGVSADAAVIEARAVADAFEAVFEAWLST